MGLGDLGELGELGWFWGSSVSIRRCSGEGEAFQIAVTCTRFRGCRGFRGVGDLGGLGVLGDQQEGAPVRARLFK
jgi:hypothetical protein